MYPIEQRLKGLSLLDEGLSLNAVSRQTGISRSSLRDWRTRGVRSHGRTFSCWRCRPIGHGPQPEYSALLGYYLSDGCIARLPRTHDLRVSCDRNYPAIIDDVVACIQAVKGCTTVGRVPAPGVVVVQSYWQHWPCVFPQHGPGRKHLRKLHLEDWQREIVSEHPGEFLRGLMHSDGCRVNNWTRRMVAGEMKRYDYPRWQFVNHSDDIRQWCCEALDLLEIPWRRSSWKTISVSTRAGVARLDELVGTKT